MIYPSSCAIGPEQIRVVGVSLSGLPPARPMCDGQELVAIITNGQDKQFAVRLPDQLMYDCYRTKSGPPGKEACHGGLFPRMELFFVPEGSAVVVA
jgi:hypothetical protein